MAITVSESRVVADPAAFAVFENP